jgi:uncharacterized repeat protein (TIGR03803 family)
MPSAQSIPAGINKSHKPWCASLILAGLMLSLATIGHAAEFQTLYSFTGTGGDGSDPYGKLVVDHSGVLYGTTTTGGTNNCGTVFSLTPPTATGGNWTEQILYSFSGSQGDCDPESGVILGHDGILYGTAANGNNINSPYGLVFALTPPKVLGNPWQETVLYSFEDNGDGAFPFGGLAIDKAGVLYGTTTGFLGSPSNVFSLTPPHGLRKTWKLQSIYELSTNGYGTTYNGVIHGPNNQFYGATQQAVYSLSPPTSPGGSWTSTLLSNTPAVSIAFDAKGNLFGADPGFTGTCTTTCTGKVFELTPPTGGPGPWTETDLHIFTGLGDGAGPHDVLVAPTAVIGTTEGTTGDKYHGFVGPTSVFALTAPASPDGDWTKQVIERLNSQTFPNGLTYAQGKIYGVTFAGGDNNSGTVFMIQP